MTEDNPQLEAWLAAMAHRYPHARSSICFNCKLPYAVYAIVIGKIPVSVHKKCPDFAPRAKQPPIGLTYHSLLKEHLRRQYPDRSVAVIHAGQVQDNFEEFYALLKTVGVDDPCPTDEIILIEMDPEEMVGFVNNFPTKFCYAEGWENGQCVTENT